MAWKKLSNGEEFICKNKIKTGDDVSIDIRGSFTLINRKKGRVAVYVRENWKVSNVNRERSERSFEILNVEFDVMMALSKV